MPVLIEHKLEGGNVNKFSSLTHHNSTLDLIQSGWENNIIIEGSATLERRNLNKWFSTNT